MAPSFDDMMAEIADQHRFMLERHARWVDAVTSSAVRTLRLENKRLQAELAAARAAPCGRSASGEADLPGVVVDEDAIWGGQPAVAPPNAVRDRTSPLGEPETIDAGQLVPSRRQSATPKPLINTPNGGLSLNLRKPQMKSTKQKEIAPVEEPSVVVLGEEAWSAPMAPVISRKSSLPPLARRGTQIAFSASSEVEKRVETKERRRLRLMFHLASGEDEVPFEELTRLVSERLKREHTLEATGRKRTDAWVIGVLRKMETARRGLIRAGAQQSSSGWFSDTGFALEGLAFLIGPDGHLLLQQVPPEDQMELMDVATALRMMTADELVEEAAKGTVQVSVRQETVSWQKRAASIMNVLVVTVVMVNVFVMGISIDHEPEHSGWLAFEAFCVWVFIVEALFKIGIFGFRDYVAGPAAYWNALDVAVTFLSAVDLAVSIWGATAPAILANEDAGDISSLTRPAALMRTLRIVRVIRLAKLLHSPLLRDLANMLAGFVIGLPALLWVLVVFCFVLYLLALIFRLMLGPSPGQDLIYAGGCGYGDDIKNFDDPVCKLHYIYGEEFFGTVSRSMFTVFRFMLGDYSTRGGKSMVIALAYGYGAFFEAIFVTFMIVVIFGLFNIITAIFVDSTTAGLKHNDVKRKYAQQYEREFVRGKLTKLVERILQLASVEHEMEESSSVDNFDKRFQDMGGISFDEEQMAEILRDPELQEVLGDLDVTIFNPAGMFDTFDANGDGRITVLEFIQVVMKLRGDPQKTDIIGCVVGIRSLQERMDELALTLQLALEPDPDATTAASAQDNDSMASEGAFPSTPLHSGR